MTNPTLVAVLARAFLAGESTIDQIAARVSHTLGRRWPFMDRVTQRYVKAIADRTRPRHRDVVGFLRHDPDFARHAHRLSVKNWLAGAHQMQPVSAAAAWDLPVIESV